MLEASLRSMLDQTFECSVFLMIDGEVPEELSAVISDFELKRGISVLRRCENRGLAFSLNELLAHVERMGFDYIARMDADDISLPARIASQVDYFERNSEVDILGTACFEFSHDVESVARINCPPLTHGALLGGIIRRSPFVHPSVMFRVASILGCRYPENTRLTEDYAFWIELASRGLIFANISEPLIYYRISDSTLKRRQGFRKAWSDFSERVRAIRKLSLHSFGNYAYCVGFFGLRLLPVGVAKIVYAKLRG